MFKFWEEIETWIWNWSFKRFKFWRNTKTFLEIFMKLVQLGLGNNYLIFWRDLHNLPTWTLLIYQWMDFHSFFGGACLGPKMNLTVLEETGSWSGSPSRIRVHNTYPCSEKKTYKWMTNMAFFSVDTDTSYH